MRKKSPLLWSQASEK